MNKKVLILLICSLIAVTIILGISYGFFMTGLNGNVGDLIVTTATIGDVEYVTSMPSANNVLPGWSGEGTTSVYLKNSSTESVNYECTVSLPNDSYANNIYVQTISGSDAKVPSMVSLTTSGVVVSSGTLSPEIINSGTGLKHNVTYRIIFNETGSEQNSDQEMAINILTVCELTYENSYSFENNNDSETIPDSYKYWSNSQVPWRVYYASNEYPESALDSFEALNLGEGEHFIRTSMLNGNAFKHEACLYYNNNFFCTENNKWLGEEDVMDWTAGQNTKNQIKMDMESALHTTATSCSSFPNQAWCDFGNGTCGYNIDKSVSCHTVYEVGGGSTTSSNCMINASGEAACG